MRAVDWLFAFALLLSPLERLPGAPKNRASRSMRTRWAVQVRRIMKKPLRSSPGASCLDAGRNSVRPRRRSAHRKKAGTKTVPAASWRVARINWMFASRLFGSALGSISLTRLARWTAEAAVPT